MQSIDLNEDITVAYIRANRFPEGVLEAHQQLHKLVSFDGKRGFYGVSFKTMSGGIDYLAAVEYRNDDACFEKLEKMVIKKGRYLLVEIKDFHKNIPAIGETFQSMIIRQDIDPQGACIEWYPNLTDVHCMVRLAD
jgi:predicted transcriptional regulator YdeE